MEQYVQYGAVGLLGLFMYLQNSRQLKQDERQEKQDERNHKMQSNHMNHNTDAINKLSHCIEDNTEASRATVGAVVSMTESVDNCEAVQEARERKR